MCRRDSLAPFIPARANMGAPLHKDALRLCRGRKEGQARALCHTPGGKGEDGMEQGHDSLVQHVSVLVGIDDTEKICVVIYKDITFGHVEFCSRTL